MPDSNPLPPQTTFTPQPRLTRPLLPVLRFVLIAAGYLILFTALDRASALFETSPGISPWSPSSGLGLTLLLVFGLRYTPLLLAGQLISGIWTYRLPISPLGLLILALIITLEYGAEAALLRYRLRIDLSLQRLRDVTWFVLVTLITPLIAGMLSVAFMVFELREYEWSNYTSAILNGWIGEVIGVLILTPFLLLHGVPRIRTMLARRHGKQHASTDQTIPRRSMEIIVQAASIVLTLWVASKLHLFFFCFLPLIWITLRHGLPGATACVLTIDAGALFIIQGSGSGLSMADLQLFMLTLALTGLFLGSVITEQKQAEEELRESEERYRSLVETAGSAIVCLSLERRILEWNYEAEHIYGWQRQEVIGKDYFELFFSDTVRVRVAAVFDSVSAGETIRGFETEVLTRDGTERTLLWNATCLTDTAGQPICVIASGQDITARKQAEELTKLQQQQLIQADKMVSLGILVSGVAHEINNPNNFITLNAKLLSRVWNEVVPLLERYYQENGDFVLAGMPYTLAREKIGQLISGISQGASRIQKIVQSLKDFAHRDAGELNQQVNINSVVESAIVIVDNLIQKSTHRFSVEYGDNLPKIRGNAQQLEQVIINLITNSCQALQDKEKKLTVGTSYDKDSDSVIVEVRDEGMGISPKDLEHIIEPFFTTKRNIGGIGLGLSVSYNIVKNHGGKLNFTSEPGKGTIATMTLPVNHHEVSQRT